ncbi:MAG: hypothetical protein PHT36_02270 [Patescibacteria group bacterium]|nr:hypothetical protein [Patescibacteria group bacterium]
MQYSRSNYIQTIGSLSVDELPNLSPHIVRRLSALGINTIEDLVVGWSERDLLVFGYRIGRKAIGEINAGLLSLSVCSLGKSIPRKFLELLH